MLPFQILYFVISFVINWGKHLKKTKVFIYFIQIELKSEKTRPILQTNFWCQLKLIWALPRMPVINVKCTFRIYQIWYMCTLQYGATVDEIHCDWPLEGRYFIIFIKKLFAIILSTNFADGYDNRLLFCFVLIKLEWWTHGGLLV